jgi:hypothetical protein
MVKGLAKSRTACTMISRPSVLTHASENALSGYSPMTPLMYHRGMLPITIEKTESR